MNRRTLLSALAAAIALLFAGYSAYWWFMADRLAAGIDAWIAAERQAGLTISADRTSISGFPLSFTATFRQPRITGAIAGQSIDWQGPDVEAHVWPFDLRIVHLSASGAHRLVVGAATTALAADPLDVWLRFDAAGRLSKAETETGPATLTLPDGKAVAFQSAALVLEAPAVPPQTDHDPLLQFALSASALALPSDVQLLTVAPVDALAVQGIVKGPMPPAPLKQALGRWRDQGGAVEITGFTAAQAPLSVSGTATIVLDADLQPIVAADLKARGLGPAVDLLAQQKRMSPNDVLKAKLFIAATEHDAPGGKEVATGLTIQNGFLAWGAFRLARVARIEWP